MGDRLRENTSSVLFKIVAGVTVLDIILLLIFRNVSEKPSGTYLTDYYIENLRSYYLFNTISQILSFLFIGLFITCVLTALVGSKPFTIILIGIDIAILVSFFVISAAPLLAKPHVETSRLVYAEYQRNRYSMDDSYVLIFENGASKKINSKDYEYGSKGKKYNLVMCGNKCLEAYDAKEYLVPAS